MPREYLFNPIHHVKAFMQVLFEVIEFKTFCLKSVRRSICDGVSGSCGKEDFPDRYIRQGRHPIMQTSLFRIISLNSYSAIILSVPRIIPNKKVISRRIHDARVDHRPRMMHPQRSN